jgi:hypothetical protein
MMPKHEENKLASEMRKELGLTTSEVSDERILRVCKGSFLEARMKLGLAIKSVIEAIVREISKLSNRG